MQLLRKLHQNYVQKNRDSKISGKDESKKDDKDTGAKNDKGRKPNFFERKRFVNYEETALSDDEKDGKNDKAKKPEVTKEIKDGAVVASVSEPIIQEESVSAPAAKKSKPQAVKSAAPPKKEDKKVEDLKVEKKKSSEVTDLKAKKDKTDSYSDDWGDTDLNLEDKGDKKKSVESKKDDKAPPAEQKQKDNLKVDDFFNVKDDPILGKQPENQEKKDESNDDFFKNEFNDLDFDKEFNSKNPNDKKDNPFSGSITKELLQQSKKEIEKGELNALGNISGSAGQQPETKGAKKTGLYIEIDENADIAEQDGQAQQMLFENVMKNENKMAAAPQTQDLGAQPPMSAEQEDEEQYTEEGII